jgi:hypothetical protein
MRTAGISGPCFISIGDTEKLKIFFENNPKIDKSNFLVDGYSLSAYNTVGFKNIMDDQAQAKLGSQRMRAPSMSFSDGFKYMKAVGNITFIILLNLNKFFIINWHE